MRAVGSPAYARRRVITTAAANIGACTVVGVAVVRIAAVLAPVILLGRSSRRDR